MFRDIVQNEIRGDHPQAGFCHYTHFGITEN